MRIAITAKGAGLGAWLDPHFGKCLQVVVVDQDGQFEAWANPFREQPGGQGLALAHRLVEAQVGAVVTGILNPGAFDVLTQAGIQVFSASQGSLLELAEEAQTGKLLPVSRPDVEHSFVSRGEECQ